MNETSPIQGAPSPIDQAPPLKGVAKKIAQADKRLAEAKESHAREIELLRRMASIIDQLPDSIADKASLYGEQLDIDHLSRNEAVEAMRILHAGKWDKTINSGLPDMIDYEATIDGVTVRLWAAGPPDSCRVIETEEIIPAMTVKVRRLVCSDKETQ